MTRACPPAPIAPGDLQVNLIELTAGSELIRFHSPSFDGNSFNPNTGKVMEEPTAGARFNPFPDRSGANVPTLYAGSAPLAAALESVFHDVPHVPDPPYPASKLKAFVFTRLRLARPVNVLELVNRELRQVPVPARDHSLEEGEIIHSSGAAYPFTRTWARYFHQSLPPLAGLAWRPRLGGEGLAYVFFGDRIAPGDFEPLEDATPLDHGPGRDLVESLALKAHIQIIKTR